MDKHEISRLSAEVTDADAIQDEAARSDESCAGEIALSVPSESEYVRVVRLTVIGVATRMPFSYDDIEDIKLAVSEACNNAILHAKSADSSARKTPILVRLTPFRDRLEISVEDGGQIPAPGLPVKKARKPVESAAQGEIPEGGMGLFLIETLMDEVVHQSGDGHNTVVRMTKFLPAFARRDNTQPHTDAQVRDGASENVSPARPAPHSVSDSRPGSIAKSL